jgi:NitT/TauT family transport system substrate-binding protein
LNIHLLQKIFLYLFTVLLSSCTLSEDKSTTIRLAYLQSDLHHLPAFVALEKGFYQDEGVTVEVSGIFKAGPEMMSGFSAGSIDAGYVGLAPVTVAVANKTAQLKILAQVNKNGSALVIQNDVPFTTIAELRSKVIAIPGHATIQDFLLRKALLDSEISGTETTVITIKPPEMIGALKTSQIDSFIAWEPYPSLAITRDAGKILTYSKDIWPDHPCCVLVVDAKFLRENPSQTEALLKAHLAALTYIKNNPDDAVRIGIKYTAMDKKTVNIALKNIEFDHHISRTHALEYIDFLNKLDYTNIKQPRSFLEFLTVAQPSPSN